jgi:hypothetical protein
MTESSHIKRPYSPHMVWSHFFFNLGVAAPLIAGSLLAGVLGYRYTEGMEWIDALLNASMIMGGMGPVDGLRTWEGKLFASFYALYSGLFLIAVTGYLLLPFFNRVLHKFHSEHDV